MSQQHPMRLTADQVHWRCDVDALPFETTEEVDPAIEVMGQRTATEALEFGIRCMAPGQNIYVRGPQGTGRMRMVMQSLERYRTPTADKRDYCYVNNFSRPQQPRLVTLPAGTAPAFRRMVGEFADFIVHQLQKALSDEPYRSERQKLQESLQQAVEEITGPLEKALAENELGLVSMQNGPATQTVIFPVVEGEPVPPQQLKAMVDEGKVPPERWAAFEEAYPQFQQQLQEVGRCVAEQLSEGRERMRRFTEEAARALLDGASEPLRKKFPQECVKVFLQEVIDDVVEYHLEPAEDEESVDLKQIYGVNIVLTHQDAQQRPVVHEPAPSLINLLGTVEPQWGPGGVALSDYRGIRAGALLRANHGYLVLDVKDVLSEPGAWTALMRTLRTGLLEIVPPEAGWLRPHFVIQPEPIPINVRVILIGDPRTYYLLDRLDQDFRELFKVLADFDSELPRNTETVRQYASVVSYLSKSEGMPPFHKSAIAALAEHGARVAARSGKLSAKFGRIADLAREAAFLAGQDTVTCDHVKTAIARTKQRASMPSRKFQEFVEQKILLLQTSGQIVGQINGLAVMHSGPLTYGFPARITATIGPGQAGLINIEGQSHMSGSIHTKGFHILGGLLRTLLPIEHPLAFSASIAFEQSYGGIDGDSASGAEMVCLLSALTDLPVRQNMAITGAVDQRGNFEAIGGVNEKIEGFFDACQHFGLTGDQGVVIPLANAGDLQLRDDLVRAIDQERFHVYAVPHIRDAIELMLGVPAGELVDGKYPEGTVLAAAVERATEFWKRTLSSPTQLTKVIADNDVPDLVLPGQLDDDPRDKT